MVTPVGHDAPTSWQSLLAGSRGGRWLTNEDVGWSGSSTQKWFGAPAIASATDHRLIELARSATTEAIESAGLSSAELQQAACVIGTSKPDLRGADDVWTSGDLIDVLWPSSPAKAIAQQFHCQAGCLTPVAACATGLVSIIRAANLIRSGQTSLVLAGSTDSSLHAGLLASYKRLGVLANPGDDPATACRPFDSSRSGFIVGEGAATLVLEEWESAIRRGATPIAEWIDGRIGSDPTAMTSVDETGQTLAELLRRLLRQARLSPEEIRAVNFHGTATTMNDLTEQMALGHLSENSPAPPVGFGIKGAIGHLMGAAGAVETATCVLALRDQILPPTVNHETPEPDFAIPLTASPTALAGDHLLKVSLGFGGHVAAGILKRV